MGECRSVEASGIEETEIIRAAQHRAPCAVRDGREREAGQVVTSGSCLLQAVHKQTEDSECVAEDGD